MLVATDTGDNDKLTERIRARIDGLPAAIVRVLDFIDSHRLDTVTLTAADIGVLTNTSDATVIRAVKALGYDGLNDLKEELSGCFGQGQSPADKLARTLSGAADSIDAAIDCVMDDHAAALQSLNSAEARFQMASAVKIFASARRIGVFGLGPSSHLARYFALQMSRMGRPTVIFDGSGSSLPDQLIAMPDVDVVAMLAYGRPYKEALACIAEARRLRKRVVLITDFEDLGFAGRASAVINVHRGQAGRIALHGATFVCLEAIILAVASRQKSSAVMSLKRLHELRKSVSKLTSSP